MKTRHGTGRWRPLAFVCAALALAVARSGCLLAADLTIGGSAVPFVATAHYYSFQPSALDARERVLHFSISGQPAWAQFDPATGRLYGSVRMTDVGLYRNIVISVSNGVTQVALPAFTVNVVPSGATTSSVTLTWEPPTENTDSSALVDLAGYHVYYYYAGAGQVVVHRLDFNNAGLSSAVVPGLVPGLWHFYVAAYNSQGVQGELSRIIAVTVN